MKLILVLLFQCISSTAFAAAPVTAAQMRQALSKYQSIQTLEVPFKQTKILKDMDLKLVSEGVLKVAFPNKVEWKVLKPQPLDMLLDADKITLKSDGKEQTFKASEGTSKDQRSFRDLLNWLKLDADALLQNYEVAQEAPRVYRFVSKDKESPIKALRMTMATGGDLQSLNFEEMAGDEIHIDFGKAKVTPRK